MKRPLFLSILMWFAGIYAVGAVLGIFAVVFDLGRLTGGYSMGGMAVSREAWLHIAAPLVATVALLMGATAIGLKNGRRWSRITFICIWPVIVFYGIAAAFFDAVPWALGTRAVIDASCVGAIAGWFLFAYKPSRSYFEAIRKLRFTK